MINTQVDGALLTGMLNGSMKEYVNGARIAESVDRFSSSYTSSSNNNIISNNTHTDHKYQQVHQSNGNRINGQVNSVCAGPVDGRTNLCSALDVALVDISDTTKSSIANTLYINQLRAIRASENEWAKQLTQR